MSLNFTDLFWEPVKSSLLVSIIVKVIPSSSNPFTAKLPMIAAFTYSVDAVSRVIEKTLFSDNFNSGEKIKGLTRAVTVFTTTHTLNKVLKWIKPNQVLPLAGTIFLAPYAIACVKSLGREFQKNSRSLVPSN